MLRVTHGSVLRVSLSTPYTPYKASGSPKALFMSMGCPSMAPGSGEDTDMPLVQEPGAGSVLHASELLDICTAEGRRSQEKHSSMRSFGSDVMLVE